jgi:hypothetical protein
VNDIYDSGSQDTYEQLMTSAQNAKFVKERKQVMLGSGQDDKIEVVQKYVELQCVTH